MIAGAGFAMMAWRLAQIRVAGRVIYSPRRGPYQRGISSPISAEYYRIIDAAWAHRNASRVRF